MQLARLMKHVSASHWRTRLLFPKTTLDAIEQAVARAERTHAGEIRFAIETSLAPLHIINEMSPRDRALEVFAHLRVWDTEHNNGVLIYVQLADRDVEIVADRGLHGRVGQPEWEAVCRLMEDHFRAGRYHAGAIAGVDAVGTLLARHFPPPTGQASLFDNQLPDRPTLL
ncbi:MAG TPA: TPM domain-containing protein [Steroidobacteraceae bacterium]|nr:TPM domain-containing protein [Steroidobacteraceae bacterium]